MKRFSLSVSVCVAIMSFFLVVPHSSLAQQAGDLNVTAAVICKNVANRQPIEPGKEFSGTVGKLYCYSKIADIRNTTQITHVWYYKDTERARVTLGINPPNWRTYSSKIIQAHEVGDWQVAILDAAGNSLQKVDFKITN